jgi:hypothetical protein
MTIPSIQFLNQINTAVISIGKKMLTSETTYAKPYMGHQKKHYSCCERSVSIQQIIHLSCNISIIQNYAVLTTSRSLDQQSFVMQIVSHPYLQLTLKIFHFTDIHINQSASSTLIYDVAAISECFSFMYLLVSVTILSIVKQTIEVHWIYISWNAILCKTVFPEFCIPLHSQLPTCQHLHYLCHSSVLSFNSSSLLVSRYSFYIALIVSSPSPVRHYRLTFSTNLGETH